MIRGFTKQEQEKGRVGAAVARRASHRETGVSSGKPVSVQIDI